MSYIIREKTWRIDRRIPLLFIATLVFQIAAVLVWAAQLDTRVTSLEKNSEIVLGNSERLARMEEKLDGMRRDFEYLKGENRRPREGGDPFANRLSPVRE